MSTSLFSGTLRVGALSTLPALLMIAPTLGTATPATVPALRYTFTNSSTTGRSARDEVNLAGTGVVLGDDGLAISGTLVSPVNAVGTIDVPACPAARWWADKSGVSAASRSASPRR